MRKEYEEQLKVLKEKMVKAEAFAEKLPVFAHKIFEHIYTGEERRIDLGSKYGSFYFAWGINRYLYEKGTNCNVTNYEGKYYKQHLFNLYVNTLCVYDSHEKYGLNDIEKKCDVFFYDKLNSTFYATDDQVEKLLIALDDWREKAIILNKESKKQNALLSLM